MSISRREVVAELLHKLEAGFEFRPPRTRDREDLLREFEIETYRPILKKILNPLKGAVQEFLGESESLGLTLGPTGYYYSSPSESRIDFLTYISEKIISLRPSVLVELGAGLAEICRFVEKHAPEDSKIEYFAGDVSPSAIQLLSELDVRGMTKIKGFEFDLDVPEFPIDFASEGLVFFTSCSIMYLKSDFQLLFNHLVNFRPKYVLHVEPVFQDLNLANEIDELVAKYIIGNDYNLSWFSELENQLKLNNNYRLIEHLPNVWGLNPLLPTSIVLWGRI